MCTRGGHSCEFSTINLCLKLHNWSNLKRNIPSSCFQSILHTWFICQGQAKHQLPSSSLYKKQEPYPTPDTVYSFENLHFITLLGKVKYTDRNIILVETSTKYNLQKDRRFVRGRPNISCQQAHYTKSKSLPQLQPQCIHLKIYISLNFW